MLIRNAASRLTDLPAPITTRSSATLGKRIDVVNLRQRPNHDPTTLPFSGYARFTRSIPVPAVRDADGVDASSSLAGKEWVVRCDENGIKCLVIEMSQ